MVCEARMMPQNQCKKESQSQKDSHQTVSLTKATMDETVCTFLVFISVVIILTLAV